MQLSTFLNLKILLMFLFTDVFLVVYLFGSNNIHYNVQQFYSAIYNNKIFNQLRSNNITTRKNKNILMWNGAHIEDTAPFGFGHEPFIRHGCEISTCVVFNDPSSLPFEEYDAILVHMHEISKTHMPYFQRQKHRWTQSTSLLWGMYSTGQWVINKIRISHFFTVVFCRVRQHLKLLEKRTKWLKKRIFFPLRITPLIKPIQSFGWHRIALQNICARNTFVSWAITSL